MHSLGKWGETIAADHLAASGFEILERNWQVPEGELDLIASQDGILVFVEVKTRRSTSYGAPEEAIDSRKKRRLQRAAWRYLQSLERLQADWRIDVIAIEQAEDGMVGRLDHYVNAVDAAEDLLAS